MRKITPVAALTGALILVCAVVAWQWYSHLAGPAAATAPVQAITAVPSAAPAASPIPTPSPTPQPTPKRVAAQPALPAAATPAPSATLRPTAETTETAEPEPLEAGGATPESRPIPTATLAPSAVAAPNVKVPQDAPPRILAVNLSSPVVHGGQVVSGTVETSSNVASVEARIGGYGSSMKKVGVGRFELSYRVPYLPFFLHRTYNLEVVARNTRGDAVSSSIPITVK